MVEPENLETSASREQRSARPRRRRALRALVILAVALPLLVVLLAVGIVVFLPSIVSNETLREKAVRALTDALGVPVEIGRLDYHPLSGIELFDVRIGPPPGFARDVARISRVALRYDLSSLTSRRLVLREVAVETPTLTLETRIGPSGLPERNVDVLARGLEPGPPEESAEPEPLEPSPPEPSRGPVSPIDVVLERFAIEDLTLEAAGIGPTARLSGVSLRGQGTLDRARLESRFVLAAVPGSDPANVRVRVPGTATTAPVAADLALALTTTLAASAGASDGLTIEGVSLGLSGALSGQATQGERALPPIDLRFGGASAVDPRRDRAELSRFTVDLGGARLMDAGFVLEGLVAALVDVLGPLAGESLAASLGIARAHPEGVLELRVVTLGMPLGRVEPFARLFVPGLSARGSIAVAPLELEATLAELQRGDPRALRLVLGFESVAIALPGPNAARIGSLEGALELARRPEGGGFGLSGKLVLEDLAQAKLALARLEVQPTGTFERLVHPLPGAIALGLELHARGARQPGVEVRRLDATLRLAGAELLSPGRAGLPPIEVDVSAAIDRVEAATGTTTHALEAVRLGAQARLDRLLEPAELPIGLRAELDVGRVASGDRRVEGGALRLEGELSDPRSGEPIDVHAVLSASLARVQAPPLTLERARLETTLDLAGIAERKLPGQAPGMLPATAVVAVAVALPSIALSDPELGEVKTSASLRAGADVDLTRGSVVLRTLALDAHEVLHARASGSVAGVFQDTPRIDARLEVQPVDLAQLVARLPAAIRARLEGLEASGTIALEGRVRGVLPAEGSAIDLENPPVSGEVALTLSDVGVKAPAQGLRVEGLAGRASIDVVRGRSELTSELVLGRFASAQVELEDLRHHMHAGLRGEVWSIQSQLDARTMRREGEVDSAPRLAVDVVYTRGGDLEVRRFDAAVPLAGVELGLVGRLARRSFGVLRPELTASGRVDLDRLRTLAEAVGDSHGVVSFGVEVASRSETELDLRGSIELDGLSHARPGLVVRDATGRLPFEQRLALPKPVMREAVAGVRGMLGDDLEARLLELAEGARAAKLYFDAEDILLEAPRAADHQPLRPFYGSRGAKLSIGTVEGGGHVLRAVSVDGLWRSGVLRVDRFAARLWEGDVLGDFALQLTADQNVRARIRATLTHLNLDIPYALANGISPVTDPKEKEQYAISGTLDMSGVVRDQALTMKMDLTKLDKPTLDRLFDGLIDPKRENPTVNNARSALGLAAFTGLRTSGGQISISKNLLNAHFDFDRVWFDIDGEALWKAPLMPFRWLARLALGPIILANVNGAIENYSISHHLAPVFARFSLDTALRPLVGRVIADEAPARNGGERASP